MRVGAVSYLNTKPLVHGLADADRIELSFDLPSRLADRLAAGQLDVALIPSLEFFQNPEYSIVSDACIGCRGPVLSVKLFSRVPTDEIRTLALDEGSRTSAGLVRVLLDERHGVRPELQPLPIDADWRRSSADAVLLIGDRAIHADDEGLTEVWDLGDQWCRWAELPFVFAMWVARPGVDTAALSAELEAARDRGLANLPAIAAAAAPAVDLSAARCLSYLRDNLHFTLGPREQQGLRLYYQHLVKLGLAPSGWVIEPSLKKVEGRSRSPLPMGEGQG